MGQLISLALDLLLRTEVLTLVTEDNVSPVIERKKIIVSTHKSEKKLAVVAWVSAWLEQ